MRPGGMLVEERDVGVDEDDNGGCSSRVGPMIKINVSHALHYEVFLPAQSTFGDVKKLLVQKTGLEPEQQRLFFRGKEKEDEEHFHTEGVNDKTRLLLLEKPASKERKLEDCIKHNEMLKASEAVAGVRLEVDKLSERVAILEVAVDGGTKVSEEEFWVLTELLIKQLLKLDTIEAEGEAKLQRKAEVLRVQQFVDILDSLKARNSEPFSNKGNAVKVKKLLVQKTGLEREDQCLFFGGKEKEDNEHLHIEGVNNKKRLLLPEEPASKERKLEDSRIDIEMLKASEAVARIRLEVDELSERVVALKVVVDGGTKISAEEFRVLTELLMKQLLKLDTIQADGEAKLQRKAEVLRVQNFVDTLDSLKARNSSPFSDNGNVAKAQTEYPSDDYVELHEEVPEVENTSVDSLVTARTSQQGEVHNEKLALGGSFLEKELERLVVGLCLPQEDALLLSTFFSVHPSMLLTNPEHSDSFISFGYRSLVRLLRFLEHHTPASLRKSDHLEFLKMLRDLESLGFNGRWLAQTKEMVLGSLLSFKDTETQLQGLTSSEDVLMKKLKFLESKRLYLSFSLDRLTKEKEEVESSLTGIQEKISEAQEHRRKKDVHFGF